MKKLIESLAPIFVAMIWGATLICNKLALGTFDPLNLISLRFAIASVGFLLLFGVGAIKYQAIEKVDMPRFILLVLLGVFIGNFALTYGQLFLPTTIAILIVQSAPLFTVLISLWRGKQQLNRRIVIGILVSAMGSTVIAVHIGGWPNFTVPWYTYLVTMVAPICVAGFMLLGRPLVAKYGASNLSGQTFTLGGAILGFMALFRASVREQIMLASTPELISVIVLGLGATVVAYILWFYSLKVRTASQLSVYLNLIPVFGFIFAAVFLQEKITLILVLGAFIILAGVAITERAQTSSKSR